MRMKKMGRDFAQMRQEGVTVGRARSERRVIRGPELAVGAAMRMRWFGGLMRVGRWTHRCARRGERWRRIVMGKGARGGILV